MSDKNSLNHTKKVFHWKGKRVTEKKYEKNLKQVALAKNLKEKHGKFMSPNPTVNVDEININTEEKSDDDYGRRIVHLKTLGKNMFCSHCDFLLSLADLVSEKRIGLASILYLKCRKCDKITGASTDIQHRVSNGNSHYDSNTQLIIGSMNSGVGNTHINKVLTAMDIPQVNWKSFKTHESEVIKGVECMAQEKCLDAAKEERRLTIENFDKLK
ncbi:GSCOCG00012935001-RA-CDS, partial [Cotesia congregata]